MFLKLKVSCACHCDYFLSESIASDKIVCPNCGTEHPQSAKIILLLKTANEIDAHNSSDDETKITVISEREDLLSILRPSSYGQENL